MSEKETTESQLRRMCESYSDDLEAAVEGNLYRIDSDNVVIDDIDEWKEKEYGRKKTEFVAEHIDEKYDPELYDSFEEWMEDEIGVADDIDEPDQVPLSEYLDDQSLGGLEYTVDGDLELRSGRMTLCCGGPGIYLYDDRIEGYWGSDRCEWSLSENVRRALWSWFEENWGMVRDAHS